MAVPVIELTVPPTKAIVPVVAGIVRIISVPATARGRIVTLPDVDPEKRIDPKEVPAVPISNETEALGDTVPIPT